MTHAYRVLILTAALLVSVQGSGEPDAPVVTPKTELRERLDRLAEVSGLILRDLISRFHKCPGDLALLEARKQQPETFRKPHAAVDGMLVLMRDEVLAAAKGLEDGKVDAGAIRRIVWRAEAVTPLVRELAVKSKKSADYEPWARAVQRVTDSAVSVLDSPLRSREEKLRTTFWVLTSDVPEYRKSVTRLAGKADKEALKEDFASALEAIGRAIAVTDGRLRVWADVIPYTRHLRTATLLVNEGYSHWNEEAKACFGEADFNHISRMLALNEYVELARAALRELIGGKAAR